MSQNEFYDWYRSSFDHLMRAIYLCSQSRSGGSYQDAEAGLESAIERILGRWDHYRRRIYHDLSGNLMVATADGNPGEPLFSFIVRAASHEAEKNGPRPFRRPFDPGAEADDGSDGSPGSVAREKVALFQTCWERLELALKKAIRQRWCNDSEDDDPPIEQKAFRLSYKGYDQIRRCLVHRGWDPVETLDVQFKMLSVICPGTVGLRVQNCG